MRPILRTLRFSLAAGPLLLLGACDDLLQETPVDTLAPQNFYESAEDAVTAIKSVYDFYGAGGFVGLDKWRVLAHSEPTLTSGDVFDTWRWTADDGFFPSFYTDDFAKISRSNAVIENVQKITMDEGMKIRIIAEARFLRALRYFQLVRMFGGVPIWTEVASDLTAVRKERASADEVYALVIDDLKFAEQHLPDSYPPSDYGRATRGAAQALLGKVYLTRGILGGTYSAYPPRTASDLPNAVAQFRKVMTGRYSLVPNFGDLFQEQTEINSEVIFPVVFMGIAGLGSTFEERLAAPGSNWGVANWGIVNAELPFYNSYEEGDKRRDVSWIAEYTDVTGNLRRWDPDTLKNTIGRPAPTPIKLAIRRPMPSQGMGPVDFPILRYADVLLMFAEAINEENKGPTAEAYEAVNQVRRRAGLNNLRPGLNYRDFRERLYHERLWELNQELHGYFDAQRFWDLNLNMQQAHVAMATRLQRRAVPLVVEIEERDRVFPIPTNALQRNDLLVQNPGY